MGELDRKITLAQGILNRLGSNEPLSTVLSQVRSLMYMTGNSVMVALMDILIHGLINVPYQGKPFTSPAYKEAGIMHMKLCSIEDVSKLDIDEIVRDPWRERILEKDKVIILSVYEMENLSPPLTPEPGDSTKVLNLKLQDGAFFNRAESILVRLRAFVYDHVSSIWLESVREQERIKLLGPDYRFITNKLDALETPVGGILLAAVDNLASTNPDNWSLCALGCRNVIIKLGTLLWKVPGQTYVTRSGETLDVSLNKEKNRLYAYIDANYNKITPDKQALLDEANGLVKPIYDKGSKGKKQIRHDEAQTLLVDTFHFIELLDEVTELNPIDILS